MRLERLNKSQTEDIFRKRLIVDFPEAEIKPLNVILKAMEDGKYESLGLYDGEDMIGYAFLVKLDNDYLIDYLAIYPDQRNAGAGGTLVGLLAEYLKDADNIIGEVEDPSYSEDAAQKDIQERRLAFYYRNGCIDSGLRVKTFGVPFLILKAKDGNYHDNEELWRLYQSFYKELLPKDLFEKNVELLNMDVRN